MYNNFKGLSDKFESLMISLEDLVAIFEEEAQKICRSEKEAQVLATVALSDFLRQYSKNARLD